MSILKDNDKQYVMNTYARFDVALLSGKGSTCYDEDNNEYIDFTSGIGVNSLGFSNRAWVEATTKQLQNLQHISNLYYTSPCSTLAKALCKKTGYSNVFFGNSGAEANEGAIKVARKYSFDKYADKNRSTIISLVNSFHGRTITTLSATGQEVFHNYFFPFNDGFKHAIANDIESVKSQLDDTVCAIMLEFVQGEGGVIPLDFDFVSEIAKICKEKDILLIADEVQTGIGRTGKLLASEHFGILPNITSLAKGLGGGLPIGAVMCDELTCKTLGYSDHGTTFGGNPVVCAGAKVCIDTIADDDFLQAVTDKAEYIKEKLLPLDEVESITGFGLMIGIKLKTKTSKDVCNECLKNGLLVLTAKEKVRLLPPLNISMTELDKGLEILVKALG